MEELRCPGCSKEYSDTNPPRLLTMCGHTYCQNCVKSMIRKKEHKFLIRCPIDKQKLSLETGTPVQFPRNMALVEAIRKVGGREDGDDRN
jgi:nitrite reductase/ring-hydroxylating ferredoxin subunit